mgnify:CR=1 FL=1
MEVTITLNGKKITDSVDADMVLLLYSKAKFGQEQGDSRTIYMDLAKHRNGRLEVFSTIFKGEIQCFEELNAWNQ